MRGISKLIRKVAFDVEYSQAAHWKDRIKSDFGLDTDTNDYLILRQIYRILKILPLSLIKACGINRLNIRSDMGPNKPYYPNHGYFVNNEVTLNADIFHHPDIPDDFIDHRGYFLNRPEQTLYHEFAHGFDEYNGTLSLKDDWLGLSGWSEKPKKGLKRLVIREKDMPEIIGEWYYDPKAEFTRFYGRNNPWDDWADSFAFYVGGMRLIVPSLKRKYFNEILKKYYS